MPIDTRKAADMFMNALHELEESGDVEAIAGCFTDDAKLTALVAHRAHEGVEGVKQFWREYLKPFGRIHSEFHGVKTGANHAVLEWTGQGTLKKDGGTERDMTYDGCTLLEFTDEGDKVRRFRTYYDSAAFVSVEPMKT
jgi:hypothetical protein